MYKEIKKKDFHDLLKFPHEKTVDAVIVSGNSLANRDRESNLFKQALSKLPKVKEVNHINDPFFGTIQEYEIDNKLIWFDVAYGGAYLSELLHISAIFGSKENYLIGSCGGLNEKLNTGDLIIPTYTYGNESTTRMYQKDSKDNKHYPNEKLCEKILHSIKKYNVNRGPIITCQAMLAETKDDVDRWSQDGYYGVEMESSTFFAVSNHFKIPSVAILHVSDNLVKNVLYGNKELIDKKEFRNNLKTYQFEIILKNILK
jgi:purine-nucleoside phosphorylase